MTTEEDIAKTSTSLVFNLNQELINHGMDLADISKTGKVYFKHIPLAGDVLDYAITVDKVRDELGNETGEFRAEATLLDETIAATHVAVGSTATVALTAGVGAVLASPLIGITVGLGGSLLIAGGAVLTVAGIMSIDDVKSGVTNMAKWAHDVVTDSNINPTAPANGGRPPVDVSIIDQNDNKYNIEIDSQKQIAKATVTKTDPLMQSEQVALEFAQAIKNASISKDSADPDFVPVPQLRPDAELKTKNSDTGEEKAYVVTEGDAHENLKEQFGDGATLDGIDIAIGTNQDNSKTSVVGEGVIAKIPDSETGLTFNVPATGLFTMLGTRVDSFTNFMSEVVTSTISEVNNQSSVLIAQIVAGVIAGRDIEDVAEEVAVQAVAAGAIEATFQALGYEEASNGNYLPKNELGRLMENNQLATEAVKGALVGVAVTAILNGRDAGVEDYARAAASASVSRVVNQGVDQYLVQKGTVSSAAGAGITAAVVTITSSLISGQGLNEDTMRSAAVAAGTAYASTAIASSLATTLSLAGSAVPVIGTIIGAAMGVLIGNLFKSGGEKVYHNETIGSVVQTLDDGTEILVGVRETGALLRASDDIVDLVGTDGDDVLTGNSQKNTLVANGGDDMLEGRASDDALLAGAGNDYVEAGDGNDYIEGNDGNDYIRGDDGDDIILAGNGRDLLSGGKGNDQIEGEGGDDYIYGDSGDDIILGGAGNDAIHGGAGNDVLSGGAGDDVLDGSIGSDEIHGDAGGDVLFGDDGDDTLHGDSGNDIVYGDDGVDILHGDLGDDILDGGADSDLLYGGLGKDILFGQDGRDHLYGEIGDDYMVGGRGNDKLDGGAGDDVYVFGLGDGQDTIADSEGTTDIIRLANYTMAEVNFSYNGDDLIISADPDGADRVTIQDQLSDNSIEYLMFSDGHTIDLTSLAFDADNVASYNATNVVTENMIDQTTFTGTWQEVEEDRAYMSYNPYSSWYTNNYDSSVISNEVDMELYNDVQVKALKVKNRTWYGRTTVTIHYSDFIELSLMGTQGSDRIVGFNVGETIESYGGDDQVYGNSGSDTIDSGGDHDIVYGGSQDDIINAGYQSDKAYGSMGNDTINGGQGNDSLYGQWGADTIHGDSDDDFISGGFDGDTLYGDAGNDIIYGDDGNDKIYGNTGNDYVIGGFGDDDVQGDEGDDYVEGGAGSDTLGGGAGDDILRGEDGVDYLYGDAGDDLLIGGKGGDTINGGSGNDTASYAESDAGVEVNLSDSTASKGYAQGDTISNIENVIGSDYSDTLTGNSSANILYGGYGNDTLSGGGGDDVLQGGAGADVLDGGSGWDKVSYADSISGVEIDFVAGTGKYGHAEGDSFSNMEHVVGSKYDDKFIVGNSSATFEAGDGYDTVVMSGNAADYTIVLDRNVLTATRISDNAAFTFPDVERLQFDDISYGHEDFPGEGDAVVSMIRNNTLTGVTVQNYVSETISLETGASHGAASLSTNGDTFTYAPTSGYLGEDTFAVRIVDSVTGLIRIQNVDVITYPGELIESSQKVANTSTSGEQELPDIAMFADGSYVVVWYSEVDGSSSIHSRLFNPDGTAKTGDVLVASVYSVGYNQGTVTVLGNGNYAVAYSEYDTSTSKQFSTVKIFNSLNQEINSFAISSEQAYSQVSPVIERMDDDNFIVASRGYHPTSGNRIYGKVYKNSGVVVTDEFLVNPIHDEHQGAHDMVSMGNGKFVVVWSDASENGSSNTHVYGQIMDSDGNRIGEDFKINFTNLGRNSEPEVTMLANDNFVVLWSNSGTDQVFMRIYDVDGHAISEELVLNDGENAYRPSISAFDNGNFIAVWYGGGIKGQLFDSNGVAIGDTFTMNDLSARFGDRHNAVVTGDNGTYGVAWSSNEDSNSDYNINFKSFQIDTRGIIEGTSANDVLQAGSRDDTLIGLAGADTLDGGDGIDVASYEQSDAGVTISLLDTGFDGVGGHAQGDSLSNIENIIGSDFDDDVTGDAQDNHISAGMGDDILDGDAGDDEIEGGQGDDIITSGVGDDILSGGMGEDTVVLSGVVSGYNIRVVDDVIKFTDILSSDGDDGTDTLTGVEQFVFSDNTVLDLDDLPEHEDSVANIVKNQTVMGILGDVLVDSFVLHKQANHGFVDVKTDGTYTYTPNSDYLGKDSFQYVVTNTLGVRKIVDVQVNVSEDGESRIVKGEDRYNNQYDSSVTILENGNFVVLWENQNGQDGSEKGIFGQIFRADGNKLSGEFLVNSVTQGMQDEIHITSLASGGFAATWASKQQDSDKRGIYAKIFDAEGKVVQNDIQVNTFTEESQQRPQIASLQNGDFIIVWDGSGLVDNIREGGIFFQRYTPLGEKVGVNTWVSAEHVDSWPAVAGLQNGGFIIAASGSVLISGQYVYTVHAQIYDDDAFTRNDEIKVSQYHSGYHRDINMTSLSDGKIFVTWNQKDDQDGDKAGVFGRLLNSDGSFLSASEFQINTTTAGNQRYPVVTNLSNGNVIVVWSDVGPAINDRGERDYTNRIVGQLFNADGDKIGQELMLANSDATHKAAPSVAAGEDGFIVTWHSNSLPWTTEPHFFSIYAQKFNNDGTVKEDLFGTDGLRVDAEDSYYIPSLGNIEGTVGNDVIQTGAKDDIIDAGLGSDVVTTGTGADTVIITINPGAADIIIDFDVSDDVIDLVAYDFLFNGFADLQTSMNQSGTDTLIDFSNGHTLTLQNITKENLTAANFIGRAASNSIPVASAWKVDIDISDGIVNIDVLAGASDLDLDTLTLDDITDPTNGTAVITDGKIDYTPNADFVGYDYLDYTISDDKGGVVTKTLTLNVEQINDAPVVLNALSKQSIAEDSEFNFTIPDNTFDDIDGDDLIYTATLVDGSALPSWLSFDGTAFSGTPAADDVGVIVVRVMAWDSGNEAVFSDFELEVASAAIEPSEPVEPVVPTEPTTPSVPTVHDTVNVSGVTEGSESSDIFKVPDTDYTIIGKGGGDVFEFGDADGVTTSILEFDHTTDVLDISAFDDLRSFDDLTITEGSAIVHLGNGQNIHIDGITPDDLTADNFSFVESVAGSTIHGVHSESDHIRGTEGDDVLHYNADDIWDNGFYTVNMGSPDEIVEDGEMVYIRPRYKTYDVYDGGAGYDVVKLTEHGDALFLFDANGSTPLGAGSDHARVIDVEEIHAGAGDDIVDLTSFDFSHEGVKIKGGDGKDHLWGNSGEDTLYGDDGDDNLDGSAGDDDLFGGDGDDKLHGRSGDDHLHGGLGADYILTGLGEDSIDYSLLEESTSSSRDVIADFDVDNDTLNFEQLVNQGIIDIDDLTVSHEGDSTIVSADDNDFEVELLGVFAKDDIDFEFG